MTRESKTIIDPKALAGGRRQFLKAVGISVALPCMESLGSPAAIPNQIATSDLMTDK